MPPSNRSRNTDHARKIVILGLTVAAVLILYTAAWFYGASQAKAFLDRHLANGFGNFSIACDGLDLRGFPFRIGVFCDMVDIDDHASGISARFGALRSAAQVYRPGHAVIELDGPAQIRMSPDIALNAEWTLLHASARAWLDGLDRASLAYDGMKGQFSAPSQWTRVDFGAKHGEAHFRQNGSALDAAVSFEELRLVLNGTTLPKMNVASDVTFADAGQWLTSKGPPSDLPRNTHGDLRNFSIDLGNGNRAALSGTFSINAGGLVSGDFELDVRGIDTLKAEISAAFPEVAEDTAHVAETIKAFSGDGKNAVVKLTVTDGTVYMGLIPIAYITAI